MSLFQFEQNKYYLKTTMGQSRVCLPKTWYLDAEHLPRAVSNFLKKEKKNKLSLDLNPVSNPVALILPPELRVCTTVPRSKLFLKGAITLVEL